MQAETLKCVMLQYRDLVVYDITIQVETLIYMMLQCKQGP